MSITLLGPWSGLCATAATRHEHLCEHVPARKGFQEMR